MPIQKAAPARCSSRGIRARTARHRRHAQPGRPEREDAAHGSNPDSETGDPETGKDQLKTGNTKDGRSADRRLPEHVQHHRVDRARCLARHGRNLEGEADPGSQQHEYGKRCRLPGHRAMQPAGLAAEDDTDQHESGASENSEQKQKPRENRSQIPGVGQ